MSVARFAFGPRLKAHRERQGITLQDIADSTKISVALLSALERNDVAQWPKGIFRRAFLRSYARAIDIPFDPVWAEFAQLFPEDGVVTTAPVSSSAPMRLTLDARSARIITPSTKNAVAASVDAMVVLTLGLLISTIFGVQAWGSIAFVSMTYGAISTILVGGSLPRWYLRSWSAKQQTRHADHNPVATRRESPPEAVVLTLESATAPAPQPQQARARIFAVTSPHATSGESVELERRVADR